MSASGELDPPLSHVALRLRHTAWLRDISCLESSHAGEKSGGHRDRNGLDSSSALQSRLRKIRAAAGLREFKEASVLGTPAIRGSVARVLACGTSTCGPSLRISAWYGVDFGCMQCYDKQLVAYNKMHEDMKVPA